MAAVHELTREQARRVAVHAQRVDAERPTDLLAVVRDLTLLQVDPTRAIAPSADVVLWSRLGSSYSPESLVDALAGRALVELAGTVRPAEDVALYRAQMSAWPGTGELTDWQQRCRDWVAANDDCRRQILDRLRADGPTTSRDLPDTCAVPWSST